jgi:hypothetical protein
MAEMFSGDWTVDVFGHSVEAHVPFLVSFVPHRFVIEGSSTSDGRYPFDTTTAPVSVSGPSWFIRFEWLHMVDSWEPNPAPVRRIAAYTLEGGFVVFLEADNNIGIAVGGSDLPFKSIVLRCRNVDPKLNPWHPFVNPYDFIIPKERQPKKPIRPRRPPER